MQVVGRTYQHKFNYIRWFNMKWESACSSAAIKIGACNDLLASPIVTYTGWRFYDCEIDGLFDHKTELSSDPNLGGTKWGLCSWGLADFQWIGGSVHDIENEHAFYIRSSQGDVTISGVDIWEVGRKGIKVVARATESDPTCVGTLPENPGNITLTDNTITDIGLKPGDYHAGTSITVTGGQRGITTVTGNHIEFGLDTKTPGLKAAILAKANDGKPFGSGSIVFWTTLDKDADPPGSMNLRTCADVRVSNNTVLYGSNSGDRVAVQLSAIDLLRSTNNNITVAGNLNALWLGNINDPSDPQHPTPLSFCVKDNVLLPSSAIFGIADLNGSVCSPCTQPQGSCVVGGQ